MCKLVEGSKVQKPLQLFMDNHDLRIGRGTLLECRTIQQKSHRTRSGIFPFELVAHQPNRP
jgi:hypothetical protein